MSKHGKTRGVCSRRFHTVALVASVVCAGATLSACQSNGAVRTVRVSDDADDSQRLTRALQLVRSAQNAQSNEDFDKAITLYGQAVEIYRDMPAAWNNLGVLLMAQQRYLEAAECFSTAVELAPADPRPYFNLGLTWDRAGYPSEAMEHYTSALRRNGQYLPALRGAARSAWLLRRADPTILDHIKTALLIERDTEWRDWFALQRIRLENELSVPVYSSGNSAGD